MIMSTAFFLASGADHGEKTRVFFMLYKLRVEETVYRKFGKLKEIIIMATMMVNRKKFIGFALFCFMFALAPQIYAQTRAPVEVTVRNSSGEEVYKFLTNTSDPDMRRIPDRITGQRQRNPAEFIRLLAEYINEKSSNDFERVKKALNIRYDTQSYFSGRYSPQDTEAVIKRGSGVCAGYSDVFKYLCDALEIECSVVSGYARGYSSSLFRNDNVMYSNHAWNIVTIQGEKYLIDSTWDAGYLSGRNFQASYTTAYFLTDPIAFLHRHFPENSAHQLLNSPVSAEGFAALPFLRPEFFTSFELWTDLDRITEINAGENFELEFTMKPGYEFGYGWYTQSGSRIGNDVFPGRRDTYRISTSNLKAGSYILRIWIRTTGERRYSSCGEFGFVVK